MSRSGARDIGGAGIGAVLAVSLLVWAPAAAAQAVPACAPDKLLGVTLTSSERDEPAPLVATHDVSVAAEFTGTTVNESYAPPPDVKVVAAGRSGVDFIVPIAASVAITVAWHQASDPSDPHSDPEDPATRCAGSRVVTLPITAARPSSTVKLRGWKTSQRMGHAVFAVVPALKQPDLSPLEISIRTSSRARLPSAHAAARTMVVPMRTVDQVKYAKKLPSLFFIKTAKLCKFFLLTCGAVTSEVARPFLDTDALQKGIEKADVNGSAKLLARTQPALEAVRYGAVIKVNPAAARIGKPRPFGYDVQVRQSGRVVARVRMAGRCFERHDSRGTFVTCRILKKSAQLH
jgi:hypothetical protein